MCRRDTSAKQSLYPSGKVFQKATKISFAIETRVLSEHKKRKSTIMTVLSANQAMQYAQSAGFSGTALTVATAIMQAESGFNTLAQHVNSDGSVDRGIFQINSRWHSEVSDSCAYDPLCASQAAYRISSQGSNFNPWTTYTSGAYQRFLGTSASTSTGTGTSTGTQPSNVPIVGPLIDWINAGAMRAVKMIIGIVLIGAAIALLASPDIEKVAKQAMKAAIETSAAA